MADTNNLLASDDLCLVSRCNIRAVLAIFIFSSIVEFVVSYRIVIDRMKTPVSFSFRCLLVLPVA